jgi:HAD superfamily hydrolase (TIGR01549 family)
MIKAVFFDLHGTLAYFYPPRHEIHVMAAHNCGVEVNPEAIRQALPIVDKAWRSVVMGQGKNAGNGKERSTLGGLYEQELLRKAGVEVTLEIASRIIDGFWKLITHFVPYDDSIPALKVLKKRGLILGVLTNIAGGDINVICKNLGFTPYLDVTVSSEEVGSGKPDAPIFLAALQRAGVKANEAMYVGDQYLVDVRGAQGVGMSAVLVDRENTSPDITSCPRIQSLNQVEKLL